MDILVGKLEPADAPVYRELRLLALRLHPESFGSSFEEESALTDRDFAGRLGDGTTIGAWSGETLIGCVGLVSRGKRKLGHKAIIWGMFVRPEARAKGVGKRLLDEILAHARREFEEVLLTVIEGNEAAVRLYSDAGFETYGCEPRALKVGANYHHELMMHLVLDQPGVD